MRTRILARCALWLGLSVAFTLLVINYSQRHGRLLLYPTYDDVVYLADGFSRLNKLYQEGPFELLHEHLRQPPHSPFSSYLALTGFALFGPHEWAPYAANGLLIFVLLVFVDHLMAADLAVGIAAAVLALTTPLAGEMVAEFRPDMASGLVTAMAVVLLLAPGERAAAVHRRLLAGACFGLALAFKPTIFPMTLSLLVVSLAAAALADRGGRPPRLWMRQLAVNWGQMLAPVLVLGLPQFLLTGSYYLHYFHAALLAGAKPIADYKGTIGQKLAYYFVGEGGETMLGLHLYIFLGLILIGIAVALARAQPNTLRIFGLQLAPLAVAYAVPTLNPVKQQFFGVTLAFLLLFMAVQALASTIGTPESEAARRRSRLIAWAVAIAGLICAQPPPYWSQRGDANVLTRRALVERISRAISQAETGSTTTVLLTTNGTISPELLQYVALKSGIEDLRVYSPALSDDLTGFCQELERADLVLASEPGNSEVFPYLPSSAVQDKTLALVRARADFVERAAFPTLTGKAYVLFQRRKPFAGWTAIDGLLAEEGASPQWNSPRVRWGTGPSTRLRLEAREDGRYRLLLSLRSHIAGQELAILLDSQVIGRHVFKEPNRFEDIELPVRLSAGSHELQLEYTAWDPAPPRRAVLFKMLRILPAR